MKTISIDRLCVVLTHGRKDKDALWGNTKEALAKSTCSRIKGHRELCHEVLVVTELHDVVLEYGVPVRHELELDGGHHISIGADQKVWEKLPDAGNV